MEEQLNRVADLFVSEALIERASIVRAGAAEVCRQGHIIKRLRAELIAARDALRETVA